MESFRASTNVGKYFSMPCFDCTCRAQSVPTKKTRALCKLHDCPGHRHAPKSRDVQYLSQAGTMPLILKLNFLFKKYKCLKILTVGSHGPDAYRNDIDSENFPLVWCTSSPAHYVIL